MKIFSDTQKWLDPFFSDLTPDSKLAFLYLCDACDCAGVWDANFRLANFCIKRDIDWDSVFAELGNRVQRLRNGKWWLTRFVAFQYKELTPQCKPHIKVLETLRRHGIELKECYRDWSGATAGEGELLLLPEPKHETPELPFVKKKERARDLVFDALAEIQGTDLSRLTPQERGRLEKAAQTLRESERTVGDEEIAGRIRSATKAWKKKGYTMAATATTLVAHWSELTPRPPPPGIQEKLTKLEARLTELSQPSSSGRVARADLTGPERTEYERLAVEFNGLSKRSGREA